jgi:hypothetical protein
MGDVTTPETDPESTGNGAQVLALLAEILPDEEFAGDVLAARDAVAPQRPTSADA